MSNRRRSLERTERPNNETVKHDTIKPVRELRATNSIERGINGIMTKYCNHVLKAEQPLYIQMA